MAGLEFVDLSERARGHIKEWLSQMVLPRADASEGKTDSEIPEEAAKEDGEIVVAEATSEETESIAIEVESPLPVESPNQPVTHIGETTVAVVAPEAAQRVLVPETTSLPSSDISVPSRERDFKFMLNDGRAEASSVVEKPHSPWIFAGLVALLAVGSLAAGWAAGQGALNKVLEKISSIVAPSRATNREGGPSVTGSVGRISEIEVVSLNNQRWTIPFNGPLTPVAPVVPVTAAAANARSASSSNAPQGTARAPLAFNTWVLSPPVRSRSATDEGGTQNQPPPLSTDAPPIPQNDLTSSGAIGSSGIIPQTPLARPEVRQSVGIVKDGDLIHRVDPIYPTMAREQRVEGTVKLNITVGEDGSVRSVTYISGSRLLLEAATEAVRQWRYAPTLLDGRPVESHREVSLVFHL